MQGEYIMVKIRTGFVSNSSSSSFCIYGNCNESGDLKELSKNIMNKEPDKEDLEDDLGCLWDEIAGKLGLEYYSDCYNENFYLGKSWYNIGDNETGKEFKDKIKKILGDECGTYEEAWYDG
jgi:hypothetical protein